MNQIIASWRAQPAPEQALRAVLVDVDGCLTPGEGRPIDLDALAAVAAINRRALSDPLAPAITLCTGRPAPYVEVLLQAIGAFLPALAEHGGLLCSPVDYHFARHPLLEGAGDTLEALRAAVQARLVRPGLGFLQPGKETMLTFFPAVGVTFDAVLLIAREINEPYVEQFDVEYNRTCVEFRRRGVNKGGGTAWLADLIGLPLTALAGIGDSESDLSFLGVVGFPSAPANAIPAVQAHVAYVAAQPDVRGVLEIIAKIEFANRALLS
jgi:HAD superfamily hydrolase (TIGR01484 family)